MRLAVFDFDGTIYQGETLRLFLRLLARRNERTSRAVRRYFIVQAPAYAVYRLGLFRLRMMGRAMRGLARLLAGMSEAQLADYFQQCLLAARPKFRPETLLRLRAHLEAGDHVVLLSGAFAAFLALVSQELGAHAWIGTDLEMEDGRCVGRLRNHAIGPAKAEALRAYLREREAAGARFDLTEAYAYADGGQDLPLLALVGHPVAVAPDRRLQRTAERRGWEVI